MNDTPSNTPPPSSPLPRRMIRGLLITPNNHTVTEVTLDGDDHTEISRLLNCSLFDVLTITRNGRTVLYFDDEGRLTYPNTEGYFRFMSLRGEPASDWFCGRGLILGADTRSGESVGTNLDALEMHRLVHYALTLPFADVEPSITVTALD